MKVFFLSFIKIISSVTTWEEWLCINLNKLINQKVVLEIVNFYWFESKQTCNSLKMEKVNAGLCNN